MDPNPTKQSRFPPHRFSLLIFFLSMGSLGCPVNPEGVQNIYGDDPVQREEDGSFPIVAVDLEPVKNYGTTGQPGVGGIVAARLLMEAEGASQNKNSDKVSHPEKDPDKFRSKLSKKGDLIFGTLLLVFDFTSLLGNGCILLTFCCHRGSLSQGPVEVFLVNLAIVDILLAIFTYPISIMASFRHEWAFGDLGCRVYAFLCYFLGLACIFSVTSVALIRYLKTCQPSRGNRISKVSSYKILAWGYLMALTWAGMPLFGFGGYGREPYGLSCTLDWVAKDRASQAYLILVTVFCVVLPLIIIIFSYGQIILLVKQSHSLVRRSNRVSKGSNMDSSEMQLSWISGLITLGFIVGWGPYTVVSLWATFRGEVMLPMWATPIPVLLAKSSIAYNPIIYFFFTTRYREDLRGLLRGWILPKTEGDTEDQIGRTSSNNKNGRSHSHSHSHSRSRSHPGPDLERIESGGDIPGQGRTMSQHHPVYHLLVIKVLIEREDKATLSGSESS